MRRKGGGLLIAAGSILLAGAVCLTAYNLWEQSRAAESVEVVLGELDEVMPREEPEAEPVPAYVLDPDMEMPTTLVDGNEYIGILDIPALGITLPVMSQWDYPKLRAAPCRYMGSAYNGTLIIAGHNYPRHFGNLKNLAAGDAVSFTDADGNVFHYTVENIKTLERTAIEEMESGVWDLTLFTCTIGGKSRVTVRCIKSDDLLSGRS